MADPRPNELRPYLTVQAGADKDLKRVLEATAVAIQRRVSTLKPGIGGEVRKSQLNLVLATIRQLQRAMWSGAISPRVQRGMDEAAKAAETALETMTRVAYAALPEQVAEVLVAGFRAAAESGFKSDQSRKRRELSERIYKIRALHEGKIEDTIRSGLIAGLSAKELASDVYQYVSPTAPGGVSYAAMRLARTEINNAFHERQVEGAKRPGVKAVVWNLSGSHRVPDLCNVYADHDGNGQWPPDKIPDKPHPQCFCYLTYVTTPPEEFREKLATGDFDDEIERRTRENMVRLGQPVGNLTPVSVAKPTRTEPLTGEAAHRVVPRGLFKRGSLTSQQRKELQTYETGWFAVINNLLRGNRWNDPDYRREVKSVEVIRSAMDESVLPEPIQTWRGMYDAKRIFGSSWDNDLTGFEWDDLGFGSTTTNEEIVNLFNLREESARPEWAGNVKMKVLVPAGVKALETSTSTKGSKENGPQAEITLQDGLTWKVVKDHGFNPEGVRELTVEVVPIG